MNAPPRALRGGLLGLMLLGCLSPLAHGQDFRSLINEAHRQRDKYAGWRPPQATERNRVAVDPVAEAWAKKQAEQNQAEAVRVARQQAHFDDLNQSAGSALRRNDFSAALRLLEELRLAQRDAGIFSPDLQETIARTQALQAWSQARTAAEFRQAMALKPGFFNAANEDFVKGLEAMEEYLRKAPERAAAIKASFDQIRTSLSNLASNLSSPDPRSRLILGNNEATVIGGFNIPDARPDYLQDDGRSGESASIHAGLGFDDPGKLQGTMPAAPPTPTARIMFPARFQNDPVFLNNPAVYELRKIEEQADEARRAAELAGARYEEAVSANPESSALPILGSLALEARQKAEAAESKIGEQITVIEKTVTFEPFDTGATPGRKNR